MERSLIKAPIQETKELHKNTKFTLITNQKVLFPVIVHKYETIHH